MADNTRVVDTESRYRAAERASLSWRAVFAGAFIALLTYAALMALGMGIGAQSLAGAITTPDNSGSGFSTGAAVWTAISVFIGLFTGGYFAGRIAGLITTGIGATQGLVVTALFFGFLLSQIGAAVGLLGSGVGSITQSLGSATANLAGNPQVQQVVDRVLGDLNLKAPPAEVAQNLATRMLRGDDAGAKQYLASQAGISVAEANQRIDQARVQITSTLREIGAATARAVSAAGWAIFAMLSIGAGFAALGGGTAARSHLARPVGTGDQRQTERRAA